jgi:hypothetical protein
MSTNSEASSGHPLCYCGVSAFVRYSWTKTNFGRKWYGCEKYKVLRDYYFHVQFFIFLFFIYFCRLNFYIGFTFFDMMQHFGDCGYFKWADNELSTYERKMLQRLNDIEEHSRAEVRRLEQLMDAKIAKFREKQCRAVIPFIILLVLLYVSGYHGCSNHKYMLQ